MVPRDTGSSPVRFTEGQGHREWLLAVLMPFYHGCLLYLWCFHTGYHQHLSEGESTGDATHTTFTRLLCLLILLLLCSFLKDHFLFLKSWKHTPLVTLSAKSYVEGGSDVKVLFSNWFLIDQQRYQGPIAGCKERGWNSGPLQAG